ncbi:MAG: hypothetical protein PUE49_03170 [Eggerthellales bacterium]|nr:hypothetical protein [Eggerthellales bacterium]
MAVTFNEAVQHGYVDNAQNVSAPSIPQPKILEDHDNHLCDGQPQNLPVVYAIMIGALLVNIISVALTVM